MKFKQYISLLLCACVMLTCSSDLIGSVSADEVSAFTHCKTGVDAFYTVLADGTAALGNGTDAAIAAGTTAVTIPADVTYFEAWEMVHPYAVSKISANAFKGCSALTEIYIEGEVSLNTDALVGLPESTAFKTGSQATRDALIAYGIDEGRVTYQPIVTKYVAFGDSIAAGYALPTYDALAGDTNNGDRYPTPDDAFVSLVGDRLEEMAGSVVVDNQAVSG